MCNNYINMKASYSICLFHNNNNNIQHRNPIISKHFQSYYNDKIITKSIHNNNIQALYHIDQDDYTTQDHDIIIINGYIFATFG